MTGDPFVSIRCLVYNHESFLRQCLDGFVMQKTNFPYEAIVHDDASTDGSAAIIREYAEKYPDIIKPIYETENQWGKGTTNKTIDAAMHPNSKYVALCEGDDYWTDPHKLQIQIDFLESHPDYVICSHDFRHYYQDQKRLNDHSFYDWFFGEKKLGLVTYEFSLDNYFDGWWTQPLSCVFRKGDYQKEIRKKEYKNVRDDVLFYYILNHGKGMLLLREMGVYRIHSSGTWSNVDNISKIKKARDNALQIYEKERDKRAFKLIRRCTLQLLNFEKAKKSPAFLKEEFLFYYRIAPFDEFLHLLWTITRNRLGHCYRHFLSTWLK